MPLTLSECTDKERWDRFAGESPHGCVFCLTPFLDALGEEYRLLVVEESGEALAGLGHNVAEWPDWDWRAGAVCCVVARPDGILMGGADPRRGAHAIGW